MRSSMIVGSAVLLVVALACGGLPVVGSSDGTQTLGKYAEATAVMEERDHPGVPARKYTFNVPVEMNDGAFTYEFQHMYVLEMEASEAMTWRSRREKKSLQNPKMVIVAGELTNNQPVKGSASFEIGIRDTDGNADWRHKNQFYKDHLKERYGAGPFQEVGPFKTVPFHLEWLTEDPSNLEGGIWKMTVDGHTRAPETGLKIPKRFDTVVVEFPAAESGDPVPAPPK
ncbi:MAG: hypothetical protein AB8H79_17350 [Myxococcota bacterium]